MQQVELKIKNIVLAGIFNPTIFDKYFFIKNGLIKDEEILSNSVFGVLGNVQLVTNKINFSINANQIVVTDLMPNENINEIEVLIAAFIKAANLINITGLGINFNWFLDDKAKTIPQLTREYFYSDDITLFSKYFNTEDASFGVYASRNFGNSRLKLDVKPSLVQELNNPILQSVIHLSFNFHFDIKNKDNNSEVLEYLKDYGMYKKESENIMLNYNV